MANARGHGWCAGQKTAQSELSLVSAGDGAIEQEIKRSGGFFSFLKETLLIS
jgi:hypothetical protein